ncbi:hypothetical protein WS61_03305 [Burkholderia sp. ABCPW 11]|uniref:hypothetical protein n=1 Tax=Burkholderia sp. ABCPW 11 TaxID=1637859 RepID=UPI000753EA31|nr:hypothetical protein [Burkholderia sp. ABCPW 11]KVD50093.1 hypothetical protein WS61_03305 [Burkholderia sp. ABCPW 11]
MDAMDDLVSGLEDTANDGQWDQILSVFRKKLGTILRAKFSKAESIVYLMAYDCGVTQGSYGPESAVYVGMKRGMDDAMHVSAGLSLDLPGKARDLGRKHGTLMRSMMLERASLSSGGDDESMSFSRMKDGESRTQDPLTWAPEIVIGIWPSPFYDIQVYPGSGWRSGREVHAWKPTGRSLSSMQEFLQ